MIQLISFFFPSKFITSIENDFEISHIHELIVFSKLQIIQEGENLTYTHTHKCKWVHQEVWNGELKRDFNLNANKLNANKCQDNWMTKVQIDHKFCKRLDFNFILIGLFALFQ